MALTPAKVERITKMLVQDYSLDWISEEGVFNGWTREDVKTVIRQRGWALDWQGKLQRRFTKQPAALSSEADYERMVAAGTDHDRVEIRRLAVKAQQALDCLQRALVLQEERDAEEVARERETRRAPEDPSFWAHGTWGGYINHRQYDVPMCPDCQVAGDAYRVEASASGRTTPKKYRSKIGDVLSTPTIATNGAVA